MRRFVIALAMLSPVAISAPAIGAPLTITVGSLASLSGSARDYGSSQARGASLYAAQSRSATSPLRIRLPLADDQSSNVMATNQMIAFVGARVSAVLGPTLSGAAAAADPTASAAGIPVLAVTNTTLNLAQAGANVWRVCLSEDTLIPASVGYVRTKNVITTAAIVSTTGDAYSEGAAAAFRAAAATNGITIVADATMAMGSGAAGAEAAVATASAARPQAIFFAARSDEATQLAQAAAGLSVVRVGGNGYNTPDVLKAAGAATDGMIVSASWNAHRTDRASRTFVAQYKARYPGDEPDAFAAQAYAGMRLLRVAVSLGNGTDATHVRRGLLRLSTRNGVSSVLGVMRFAKGSHEASYPATVQQVVNGQLLLAPTAS